MASPATLGRPPEPPRSEASDDRDPQAELLRLRDELVALRQSEATLREEASRVAETQQRVLARLAGGMAHDFNNLLTIIAGYASLINDDEQTSAMARDRLSEILRASDSAKDLTQKLLVLSRKQPSQPHILELDQFLRKQALKPLEELIGARVGLTTQLAARDACIRIDPRELLQALTTLVLNARDAMPAGGTVTITTTLEEFVSGGSLQRARKAGAYVRLAVTDTGAGMDESVQARLFEPYFTTKRLGTGSGLGLAMLKGLIEHSGGFVDVLTAPDLGTTMTLWLPVTDKASASGGTSASSTVVRGGTESLLVVEDDTTVRELIRAILTRFGYTVTDVGHPHAALALARAGHRFDLVVSDIVMPGMDGRQLIRELNEIAPGSEFLYVSGFADTTSEGSEVQSDSARFLGKPFTPTALANKVRDLLDAR